MKELAGARGILLVRSLNIELRLWPDCQHFVEFLILGLRFQGCSWMLEVYQSHDHGTDGGLTSSKLIWKWLHFAFVRIFPQCGFEVAVKSSEHDVGPRNTEGLGLCLGTRVAQITEVWTQWLEPECELFVVLSRGVSSQGLWIQSDNSDWWSARVTVLEECRGGACQFTIMNQSNIVDDECAKSRKEYLNLE